MGHCVVVEHSVEAEYLPVGNLIVVGFDVR